MINNITVNQGVGNVNKIRFTYDASGKKLRKQVFNNANSVTYQQDYFGKIEYTGTTPVVEAIYHPEGRAVWNGTTWRYEFNLTDHLGNVRAVISDLNNNAILTISSNATINEIINVNSYYPFGLTMGGTFSNNTTTPDTRYQYNGKEMNIDLGLNLLDYGARWYDPAMGRFTSVDPLADTYPGISPYTYVANNPIKYTDPTGAYIVDQDGNRVEINKSKDGTVTIKGNLDKGTSNILNAMITTPVGLESATNLVSMDDEVRLQETSDVIKDENGDAVHGVTTAEKNKDGEFSHYNIKISTASIGDRMDNFSNEEKLNIIGTHEETHIEGGGNLLHDEGLPVSRELESRFQYSKLYPEKSDPEKNWRPNYESYLGKKEVSKIEAKANKAMKKN
ncbi:MAG: hypothetical protein RLZZ546_2321 [Bacteroidota bacterium]|jgi:RHS repeat-associated protein